MLRTSRQWVFGFVFALVACEQQAPQLGTGSQSLMDAGAIVVGAGISGLSAAVEMGRSGVDVLVLDRNSVIGGHAVMAGGFAVVGTALQASEGFEDSPEKAVRDWMQWTEDGDADWIRFYAENSRELIYDWAEAMGLEWVEVLGGHENSVPRFHFTDRGAIDLVLALYRTALELPNVTFRNNQEVEQILMEAGAVIGVIARDLRTGDRQTLRSPHVLLATGGVEGNLDRVQSNWAADLPRPYRLLIGASEHALGLGHELADQVGAALIKTERHYLYSNGLADPRDPAGRLAITAGNSRALWVNAQGQRFTNETGRDKDILVDLLNQSPATYWMIFDEAGRAGLATRGREWVKNPAQGHAILDDPRMTHKAETLGGLADKAALPADALEASVRRFNALVRGGEDADFGRFHSVDEAPPPLTRPPFYAIQMHTMTRKSMGGVAIDLRARALDADGRVVPGLYAVGEINGSAGINGKHGMDGMFLGPAVVTGRVGGRTVAAAHAALTEPLKLVEQRIETGVLDAVPKVSRRELSSWLVDDRPGYWHFKKSHEMVLERRYPCELCHSAEVPFASAQTRESRLAQSRLCVNCHGH